jgi:hypothetical protein
MAVFAGVSVVIIIIMANICLFVVRAAQFDRISGEVARSCAYRDAAWSADEGIKQAMGLDNGNARFYVGASESGSSWGLKTITFELVYQPLFPSIRIGSLSFDTPTLKRTKSYAVPTIGYTTDDAL